MLGARTRVVPGGREATKASRKEAKKRAKAEFKMSRQALERHERRIRLQDEVCSKLAVRCFHRGARCFLETVHAPALEMRGGCGAAELLRLLHCCCFRQQYYAPLATWQVLSLPTC